jgi:hypothetical protein
MPSWLEYMVEFSINEMAFPGADDLDYVAMERLAAKHEI